MNYFPQIIVTFRRQFGVEMATFKLPYMAFWAINHFGGPMINDISLHCPMEPLQHLMYLSQLRPIKMEV